MLMPLAVEHKRMRILGWAVAGWMSIVPLAIANGALRQALLIPHWGVRVAQPVSGILLILAIASVAWLLVGRLGTQRPGTWIAIGSGWLIATLAFELGVGFATGRAWNEMMGAYRFVDNNLWPLVLVWIVCAPMAMARLRRTMAP